MPEWPSRPGRNRARHRGRGIHLARGGTQRVDPIVDKGVPYYIHDYFGPGRHAKVVSTKAADLLKDGNEYRAQSPLTGDESVVAEVRGLAWPQLLTPVDDLPPVTVIGMLAEAILNAGRPSAPAPQRSSDRRKSGSPM